MPTRLPVRRLATIISIITICITGCSSRQPSGRPDLDAIPEVELRGAATKASIYEFCAKVKKRGVSAAKAELPDLLSSLEGYEKLKLGEHQETYKQIYERLKALQTTVAGSATKEAAITAADDLISLAHKLPGKANATPQVE